MADPRLKRHIPQGTQDFLGEARTAKRALETDLLQEFTSHGYVEVETPLFEYDEVFTLNSAPYTDEQVIRFFEPHGRILTLRPDMTGPIARVASRRLHEQAGPMRLCYVGNVYGRKRAGGRVETTQAGAELIGSGGPAADAEIVGLAVESLLRAGLTAFIVDVGHVRYFEGLAQMANLTEAQTERVRALIDAKNTVNLRDELSGMDASPEAKSLLNQLPGMFGDAAVLDGAFTGEALCAQAVDSLRTLATELKACGLLEYVNFDLGMLHDFHYYTGIVFRGLVEGSGTPVLSGGRYDSLLSGFGCAAPATGFAVNVTALTNLTASSEDQREDRLVVLRFEEGERGRACCYARELRAQGRNVVLAPDGWTGVPDVPEIRLPEEGLC